MRTQLQGNTHEAMGLFYVAYRQAEQVKRTWVALRGELRGSTHKTMGLINIVHRVQFLVCCVKGFSKAEKRPASIWSESMFQHYAAKRYDSFQIHQSTLLPRALIEGIVEFEKNCLCLSRLRACGPLQLASELLFHPDPPSYLPSQTMHTRDWQD